MKFNFTVLVLSALITPLLLVATAKADRYDARYNNFAAMIRSAQGECLNANNRNCVLADLRHETFFDVDAQPTPLNVNDLTVAELARIAKEQAQIWGDTILEGDYRAAGETRLDRVEGIYKGEDLVAFRITYSEQAWYTGICNTERDPSLASCQQGRIVESSFVSPQLTSWMRDDSAYAEFYD